MPAQAATVSPVHQGAPRSRANTNMTCASATATNVRWIRGSVQSQVGNNSRHSQLLLGSTHILQRWIIDVTVRPCAVKRAGVWLVQRRSEGEPLWQIGIRNEQRSKSNGIGFAG